MSRKIMAGAGEKMQSFGYEFNDSTIRFVLCYPGIIDADILCAATKALIQQVDILHGSFYNDAISAYWEIHEEYDESSYFQYIRTEGNPFVTAQSLSLLPVYFDSKCQIRVTLVQSDTDSAVVVSISHLCVDGGDGKYLLNKLAEGYRLIAATGSKEGLEVKNGQRAPEQIYQGLSLKEIGSLFKMPGSDVKSEFRFVNDLPGRIDMIRVVIPAEIMSTARKKAKTMGATANDILLTAIYRAYASLPYVDECAPMSVMSMMDLRRHCDDGESDGLANMSGTFPTVLRDGIRESFSATLEDVTLQTRAMKENPLAGMDGLPLIHSAIRTIPMKLLTMVAGKFSASMALGLTNLGNMNCKDLAMGELIPAEGLFGGPVKKKPAMQISAASFDGSCSLCIVGQYTHDDAVMLKEFLDHVESEIIAYAKEG